MDKTMGSGLNGNVPEWGLGQKGKAQEWECDNNRIYNLGKTYERRFSRLLESQPDANRGIYTDFFNRARFEGISPVRQLNYMRALARLQTVSGGLPLREIGKRHVDEFLAGIADAAPGTRQILFYCLKKFLVFLGKEELLKGVRPAKAKDIKVKPGDLLTREDLQKLLEACSTVRGRAFLISLYESGARIGEILNLEVRDLVFDDDGALVHLEGKTGARRIRLVESAPMLRRWVDEAKRISARYVWFGPDGGPSKYSAVMKFLKKTAKTAGLRKKVYPHLFRHSRASELAQKLREPQLRAFMGWTGASDMPRIYVHLSAQDIDRAIVELYAQPQEKNVGMDEMAQFYAFWRTMKVVGRNSPEQCQAPR